MVRTGVRARISSANCPRLAPMSSTMLSWFRRRSRSRSSWRAVAAMSSASRSGRWRSCVEVIGFSASGFKKAGLALPAAPAAIDHQILSGDVARHVAGQVGDSPPEIVFGRHAAERGAAGVTLDEHFRLLPENAAGGNGIDPDIRAQGGGQPAGQL